MLDEISDGVIYGLNHAGEGGIVLTGATPSIMLRDWMGGGAEHGSFPLVMGLVFPLRNDGSMDIVVGETGKEGAVPVPVDELLCL